MSNDPNIATQYQACLNRCCLYRRKDRGLLALHGSARSEWLNNLITHVITTLSPGEGNYAFATTAKGRTVFDMNVLVLEDQLWLDIDRRLIEKAINHLTHYIITEDVTVFDMSHQMRRIALLGPQSAEAVEGLGFGNLVPMAWLQHAGRHIEGADVRLVRHDFAGILGAELIITGQEAEKAAESIGAQALEIGAVEIDREVVEILRIEAGIPVSVNDIDEDVIPPETGQIERGISYHKGCYLGQEVIERMRSHDALARRLVGIRFEAAAHPTPQSRITDGDKDVGRITSLCFSETLNAVLALATVKSTHAKPGTSLFASTDAGRIPGVIVELPVRK